MTVTAKLRKQVPGYRQRPGSLPKVSRHQRILVSASAWTNFQSWHSLPTIASATLRTIRLPETFRGRMLHRRWLPDTCKAAEVAQLLLAHMMLHVLF